MATRDEIALKAYWWREVEETRIELEARLPTNAAGLFYRLVSHQGDVPGQVEVVELIPPLAGIHIVTCIRPEPATTMARQGESSGELEELIAESGRIRIVTFGEAACDASDGIDGKARLRERARRLTNRH